MSISSKTHVESCDVFVILVTSRLFHEHRKMRLINIKTLTLETFDGDVSPPYAILSHRWTDEEVTFAEMICQTAVVRSKRGFEKIARFCEKVASVEQVDYVWSTRAASTSPAARS